MPSDDWQRGFAEGWKAAEEWRFGRQMTKPSEKFFESSRKTKPKRKVSAYHKRLGVIIKRLKKKHTLKSGKWRKGWTQRRLMKTAHKEAKK